MNYGYGALGLGVLGVIIGGAMYAAKWHHTIGEAGIGVGVVLIILGVVYTRMDMKKPMTMANPPAAPAPATP